MKITDSGGNMVEDDTVVYNQFRQMVFVAFIDIIGFKFALNHKIEVDKSDLNGADNAYAKIPNILVSLRSKLGTDSNFIACSDSIAVYSSCAHKLMELTSFIFIEAFFSMLPLRCGLGYGELVHTERRKKLGTIITLYGSGYNDAHAVESGAKGCGMRVLASANFMKNCCDDIRGQFISSPQWSVEYPWWRFENSCRTKFENKVKDWRTRSVLKDWFGKGGDGKGNASDTWKVFEDALSEMKRES